MAYTHLLCWELLKMVRSGRLLSGSDFYVETFNLLPESDTSFFADDDGEEYAFILDGDSAVALTIQGFKGTRIVKE